MNRRTLLILLLTFAGLPLVAQRAMSIYKLPVARASGFTALAVGDSILLSYIAEYGQVNYQRHFWILPNGTGAEVTITKPILTVNRYDGDHYYYFVEKTKERQVIKTIVDHADGKRSEPTDEIEIKGDIIGKFFRTNLFLVVYDKKSHQVSEVEIGKTQAVATKTFPIPAEISERLESSDVVFIDNESIFNSFLGHAKAKLYRTGGEYFITYDNEASLKKDANGRTTMFASLSEPAAKQFKITTDNDFRSFYSKGKIFRMFFEKKSIKLEVIEVTSGEQRASHQVIPQDGFFTIYEREGQFRAIRNNAFFSSVVEGSNKTPSVVAYNRNGEDVIYIGSNYRTKPTGIRPFVPLPLPARVSHVRTYAATLLLAVRVAGESHDIDRYFYLSYNNKNSVFSSTIPLNEVPLGRNDIDKFEIETIKKFRTPDARCYAEGSGRAIGIYYWDSEDLVRTAVFER